jgi:hypothetical protein
VPAKIANTTSKSLAALTSSTTVSGATQQHQQQHQNKTEATSSKVLCNLKT